MPKTIAKIIAVKNGCIYAKCWDGPTAICTSRSISSQLKNGSIIECEYTGNKDRTVARPIKENSIKIIEKGTQAECELFWGDIENHWLLNADETRRHAIRKEIDYFYVTSEYELIAEGEKCLVLGRKGMGKTAIKQRLKQDAECDSMRFFSDIRLANVNFNLLTEYNSEGMSENILYETFWENVILSELAKLVLENATLVEEHEVLSPIVGFKLSDLRSGMKKMKALSISLGALGGAYEKDDGKIFSLVDINDVLKKYLKEHIGEGYIYSFTFDELDKPEILTDNFKQYNAAITGLFYAVKNIRNDFVDAASAVQPVILLRTDIFAQLKAPNKSTWRDVTVNLSWGAEEIKKMLAHRFFVSLGSSSKKLSFEEYFGKFFPMEAKSNVFVKNETNSIFEYMRVRTYNRPRDMVAWMKSFAESYTQKSNIEWNLNDIETNVSKNIFADLKDELNFNEPEKLLQTVKAVFGELNKNTFNYDDRFKESCGMIISENLKISTREFLKTLFACTIIGCKKNNREIVYDLVRNGEEPIILTREMCVHPALHRALQIDGKSDHNGKTGKRKSERIQYAYDND